MGCRCANSHEEEFEVNKRDMTEENINNNNNLEKNQKNELNNSNNNISNNSEKNRSNFSPNSNNSQNVVQNEQILKEKLNINLNKYFV